MVERAERVEVGEGGAVVAFVERRHRGEPVKAALFSRVGARQHGFCDFARLRGILFVELPSDEHHRRLGWQSDDFGIEDLGGCGGRGAGGRRLRFAWRRPDFTADVRMLMTRHQQSDARNEGPNPLHLIRLVSWLDPGKFTALEETPLRSVHGASPVTRDRVTTLA